jgi:MFS family permease
VEAALGPLVGGLLVTVSWRWIFLVNVPIGLLALVVGWIKLPKVSGHDVPAPYVWAAALITAGIGALTFGIVKLNDWGWNSPGVSLTFAVAVLLLALFVAHCLRSDNPFIDPALFRIRDFTGACLTIAPFSIAFGGFLLSLVLWEQGVWNWSAMKIGLAIAPGPLLVPVTSLLLAGRLIARFGAAMVVAAGLVFFSVTVILWAVLAGPRPDLGFAVLGIMPSGIGVGLTLPTLMGVGTSALPASSFATGSGAINMIRQTGFAVGVAIFVALVGSPGSAEAHLAAFHRAWWVMAGITVFGLIPLLLLRRRRHALTVVKPA